ncbi:ABC-type sugar transport system periplasmic component-like [Geminocystis sp. NIES-3709]|nr:ABC-type sugar transport system periplasmic component-like [Geminocystis sp. NIES-3709]
MFINAVEQFKQLNPEVNLLLQSIHDKKNPSLFIEKSGAGFGSSALIIEAKNLIELLKKRLINPIDSQFIDTSIYSPLTLSQVRYLGKIYGIPLGSNTRVLCYNKAKLNATNEPIFSTPPTDLDGLIQRAIKGYTVGLVSSFEDTFWGMGTFGGKLFNELGLLEANLDGWVKWLDWLKNASLQPNVIFSRDRTILHNAFSEGKLAYYVCESKEILDFTESLKDNFRVALLPQGDGGKATPLLYTKVIVFNHSNTDNENHLGLAFGKYITNPEQQLAGIIKTQSFIPTNRNVNLNVALLPIESVLLKQAESAVAIPLNNLEQIIQVFEKGETLYQQAFVGEISTIKAAEELMLLIGNFSS